MFEGELEPGRLIAGKYLVERLIARGGMGAVVAAIHQRLNERVAIKVLSRASGDTIGRFLREARVATRIRSEYVARVLDLGELESGVPYIVMEYLEGQDLSALLAQVRRLAVEDAVDFVLQACVALADAHRLGVIHRDLKPANLFCTRRSDGRRVIKVLDFGISKLTDEDNPAHLVGAPVTLTAMTMGTPLYMSPEQMRSAKAVDVRTDIWSLGIVLFELLAGEPPFGGESFAHVAVNVASEPVPALANYRSDLPNGLERVVRRCLEKDREQRFANIAELAQALEPFAPKHATMLVERIAAIHGMAPPGESEDPKRLSKATEPEYPASHLARVARAVPGTMAPWATQSAVPARSNRKRILLAASAVGLVTAISFGAVRLLGAGDYAHQNPALHSATTIPAASQRALPPEVGSLPAPEHLEPKTASSLGPPSSSGSPESNAPPAATAHAASEVPIVRSTPLPAPLHLAPRASASGSRATGNSGASPPKECSPPYTIDDQGRKHFKRQCYQNSSP